MQNHGHANPSNSVKARINRKSIMQTKRNAQAQAPLQATIDSTLQHTKYDGKKLYIPCFKKNNTLLH